MSSGEGRFSCCYVDHKTSPKEILAGHFGDLVSRRAENKVADDVFLVTCQRMEHYRFGELIETPDEALLSNLLPFASIVSGTEETLLRAASIAAGVSSWLIGERFILRQLETAFSTAAIGSQLRWLGDEALRIGREVRNTVGLTAEFDYPELALNLLKNDEKLRRLKSCDLIIIGGGMLGEAIAKSAILGVWKNVYLATRWPRKLRRRISERVLISKLSRIRSKPEENPYAVVIAVRSVDTEYREQIGNFLFDSNCLAAIDLSSSTLFPESPDSPYRHMYGERFTKEVKDCNNRLSPLIAQAQELLRQKVQQTAEPNQQGSIGED